MSIYVTYLYFGGDGDSDEGPPWRYVDSSTLPSRHGERGGFVEVSGIAEGVEREQSDGTRIGGPHEWVRLRVCADVDSFDVPVLLDKAQVKALIRALSEWVEDVEQSGS